MHAEARESPFGPMTAKSIFRFDVHLLSGPLTSSFLRQHPKMPSRIIDIRGSQSLEALHHAIFAAFDRYDQHMCEFQIGGVRPHDKKSQRYVYHMFYDDINENDDYNKGARDVSETSIISLNLVPGQLFFYWFDFGDEWWHTIKFIGTPEKIARAHYPRIVEKTGKSPPQYAAYDEEAGDEDALE
ncbi:MAG: plasmid pRiA4b ORF-3 family protein [Desulfovibrio sp.]|jgi:hypothetical protein|nr:plasmid pRiA4b ORF-3 family protein [Desulfovibrio sp.]